MPPVSSQIPARLRRLMRLSTLGRAQGPELFANQNTPLTSPTTLTFNQLTMGRPLESIMVVVSFRAVIAVADYTAGVPEAPQNIIDRITVKGNHRQWGNQTPIDITGASAFVNPRLYQSMGNDLIIGTTRSDDPGIPFVQTTGMTTGAQGTYDVRACYEIPMGLQLGSSPSAKAANIPFLWRPEDWGTSLNLTLAMGDKTSFGTPAATTTVTFTAFGSASGTPLVEVFLNYSLMGAYANMPGGLVIRNEYLASPALTATGGSQQVGQLLQKQITSNLILKIGETLTGTSGGVNIYGSLSDVALDATQVRLDNKYIRNLGRNYATKNFYSRMFNTIQPQGYLLISFVDGGNPLLALRADEFSDGANFRMVSDVNVASANRRVQVMQEQIFGGPFLPARKAA